MTDAAHLEATEDADDAALSFPHANATAVRALAGTVASTFGPIHHDKLVVNELAKDQETPDPRHVAVDDLVAANDGSTILEKLPAEHPALRIVRRLGGPERPGDSDVEGQDIPDGTTWAVLFTAALLQEATNLVDKGVHQQDVKAGYTAASRIAREVVREETRQLSSFDDPAAARRQVARTAMTGNDVGGFADRWTRIAVEAVDAVGPINERTFVVKQSQTGSIADSRLIRGAVLENHERTNLEMPSRIEDATILVLRGWREGGLRDPDFEDKVNIKYDDPSSVGNFDPTPQADREALVAKLVDAGVDVVVAQQGIDSKYSTLLAEAGILSIDGVIPFEQRPLCLATGAEPVLKATDFTEDDLGYAGTVSHETTETYTGRRKHRRRVVFENCPDPDAVATVLYGVFGHLADQATLEIRKGAAAVAHAEGHMGAFPGVVPGAGAIETHIASTVREAARGERGRPQLAMEAFADALERVVRRLVRNAGRDPIAAVADLRSAQTATPTAGFLLPDGEVGDALEAGVLDVASVRVAKLETAVQVTNLLLGIDDAVDATFSNEFEPGDAIYDLESERHEDHIAENDTVWDN